MEKKKKARKARGNTNSSLLTRPIRKCAVLFIGPTLVAFIIGFVFPFIQGIYLSFCKFTTTSDASLIGVSNYFKALQDPTFVHAFWYTALFAIVSLVLINLLAFMVAYVLTQKIKGANLFRTVFFMPNLIGGIVLGYIWSMIFDGILTRYGTSILMNSKWGFWGLIILMCWQQVGYMMIIYIAGFQAIPEDMMEAAKIDGASKFKTLIHVTIPNMMPSITICTFLSLTNGFKLFDQNLALTGGQPFNFMPDGSVIKSTEMLALNIFNTFYGQNSASRGVAQAKAVIFFVLVAVISIIQMRSTRSKEVQA
ncbi:MAG: sugar ABC transporter permease [Lachnospiraceae bacterium]|nr:sugar ABC transporter permease [Lachnospiraceae bacterium]